MVGNKATGTDDICRTAAGFTVVGNTATGIDEDHVSMFVSSHTGAPVAVEIVVSQQKCGLW